MPFAADETRYDSMTYRRTGRSGLDLPALSPGSYHCRLVRLAGRAGYASFAPDFCYVDGNGAGLSFTKQTGTTLPGGWLHPDSDRRQVFLGTMRNTPAQVAPPYGTNPARVTNRAVLIPLIQRAVAPWSKAELADALDHAIDTYPRTTEDA